MEKVKVGVIAEEVTLKVNDWVEVVDYPHMNGTKGYIADVSANGKSYQVQIVEDTKGVPSGGLVWIASERLVRMPLQMEKIDLDALINLALDTNDEDYFHSLVKLKSSAGTL